MEDIVKLHNRSFKIMIPAAEIETAIERVAAKLNADYANTDKAPLIIGVLNGSFIFLSDLVRKLTFDCEISFVKLASYIGDHSTGKVQSLIGLNNSIDERDVIIVEDIVDTGGSIAHLFKELDGFSPKSMNICTLFFKPNAYREAIPIKYRALEIGNEFIVGYGLDYDQLGRNLKDVYVVTE